MTDPTRITVNRTKIWENAAGQLHRLDGPAMEYANGNKYWYINDQRHRLDGPAVEWTNGDKEWWVNDKRHRLDGPAVEYTNGDKYWYVNDRLHRLDGPAVELTDGDKSWYVKNKRLFTNIENRNEIKLTVMVQDQLMKSSGRALLEQASNKVPGSKEVLLDYLLENNLIDPPKKKRPSKGVDDVIKIYDEFKANGITQ